MTFGRREGGEQQRAKQACFDCFSKRALPRLPAPAPRMQDEVAAYRDLAPEVTLSAQCEAFGKLPIAGSAGDLAA